MGGWVGASKLASKRGMCIFSKMKGWRKGWMGGSERWMDEEMERWRKQWMDGRAGAPRTGRLGLTSKWPLSWKSMAMIKTLHATGGGGRR